MQVIKSGKINIGKVDIKVLDGLKTIGGNKILVQSPKENLLLDFGINFETLSSFYDGFLSPRKPRGIFDFLKSELIPKFNIYRKDLLTADVKKFNLTNLDVKAVLITHAHLDHCGLVGLLDRKIPIVSSVETALIMKSLSDTNGSSMAFDLTYLKVRSYVDENGLVTKQTSHVLSRSLYLSNSIDEKIREFLSNHPSYNRIKFAEKSFNLVDDLDLASSIKHFRVDHSIPGSLAYIIETDDGSIAYTGDLRFHGLNKLETHKFIKEARKSTVLITEGTRISRMDDECTTEKEIYDNVVDVIEENNNSLVVANFSVKNFDRFLTFKKIARKTGRILVLFPKDFYLIKSLSLVFGNDILANVGVLLRYKTTFFAWERGIYEEYNENVVSIGDLKNNGEKYILVAGYYNLPDVSDICSENVVYIYSSSESHNEEQALNFYRLWNWLTRILKAKVYGFEVLKDGSLRFDKKFHASGHLSKNELVKMIDKIDPDILIPVHTDNPEFFVKNWGEKDGR